MTISARMSLTRICAAASVVALSACAPQSDEATKPMTLVGVITVIPMAHTSSQVLTGSVQARAQTPAAFLVSGRLTSARPSVGDRVTKGQVLAELSAIEQKADVAAAEAGVAAAQSRLIQVKTSLDRQNTLWAQGLTTRSALDGAKTAYDTALSAAESADAQLQLAQEALGYTSLVASSDGVIIRKLAEVDEVVQAGSPVYVIAEDGPRNVVINVQETAIADWSQDKTVSVTPFSAAQTAVAGKVSEIAPALDVTGTVPVKITVDANLPLGAPVSVQLRADPEDRIILPAQALSQSYGKPTVWTVDANNAVSQTEVSVENYETGKIVVTDGLKDGDVVVTAGTQFLSPGQIVEIREISSK